MSVRSGRYPGAYPPVLVLPIANLVIAAPGCFE